MAKTKRKNPSDLTLRNLHAMKKDIRKLKTCLAMEALSRNALEAEVREISKSLNKLLAPHEKIRSANSTGVGLEGGNR